MRAASMVFGKAVSTAASNAARKASIKANL